MANFLVSNKQESFKGFLLNNRNNRIYLKLAVIAIIIQFSIFKYLYPYASYIHDDSFSYLEAADQNLSINTYLIGYSKFLRLFNVFAKPDFILVAFQYLFIQFSVSFMLFTLFYFYRSGKVVQIALICFMTLNPLFLHLANLISSDGMFLGLSTIWFTLMLWIIHQPSRNLLIWHALVLFIAFTFRYNAIIYPFISAAVFIFARIPIRVKIVGIISGSTLCALFVVFTSSEYKRLTGYWQYSPFSGWQITNNAMYAYRYVNKTDRKPVPNKFKTLDNMIREYFDSTRDIRKNPQEALLASTVYMWEQRLTLYKYRNNLFKNDTQALELKKWASMGPFYSEYGLYIIKQYPWHFLKYFIWPNANKYFAPPIEFLESYNGWRLGVTDDTKKWFGYKSSVLKIRMKNYKVWVLDFYPILSGIINVIMLFGLVFYFLLKGWTYNLTFKKGILLGGSIWILNAGFTICASSAALRFQSFPIILTTTFAALLIDWMIQLMTKMKQNAKSHNAIDLEAPMPSKALAQF